MKKFIFIVAVALGLSHFAQKQTDRFTLSKIATVFLDGQSPTLDHSLLAEPFTYLGKGGQSYVFVSQDGQYVLKCFRSSRLQVLQFLSHLFPHFEKKKIKLENQLKETLASYLLAFEKLPEETGLVAIHLDGKTPISSSLKIIDKLGICHTMDPNLIPFVIQKRAILVKEKITSDPNQKHLAGLFSLLKSRIEKGIEDADPNFAKNFGFVGDHAIQIDGGRFFLSDTLSQKPIAQSKEDFQHWINANFPELSDDFHALYEEFCHEVF